MGNANISHQTDTHTHTYIWLLTVPHSLTVHTIFISNAVLLWVSAPTKRCTNP